MSYVAGYTVAHDVSARDWQLHKNGGQWLIGKSFDTFCPIGPALVTRAALSGTSCPSGFVRRVFLFGFQVHGIYSLVVLVLQRSCFSVVVVEV